MATKKITLNEFESLVKQIIKEEVEQEFNSSIFENPFMVKKWQSNGYYPIYKFKKIGDNINYYNYSINNGKPVWREVNMISGDLEKQINYYLHLLNNNEFIITTNFNTEEYN